MNRCTELLPLTAVSPCGSDDQQASTRLRTTSAVALLPVRITTSVWDRLLGALSFAPECPSAMTGTQLLRDG